MNVDCNRSPRLGLYRSLCRLVRLFLAFGMLLFAFSAQAATCTPPINPVTPHTPDYPVIFIHGINSNADETWGDFRCFLVANGWKDGGSPHSDGQITVTDSTPGDFYTLNFSDNHGLTFSAQGFELKKLSHDC